MFKYYNRRLVAFHILAFCSYKPIDNASQNLNCLQTYAVGITPVAPFPPLDQEQLENLAGSKDNVFLAENGFEDLPNLLRNEISNAVCENRCAV